MDGRVIIGTELDTSGFDKQISLLEDKLEGLEEEYKVLQQAEPFEGQDEALIKLGDEIDKTRKKITKLHQQQAIGFSNIGSGIEKATKRIGKMVLAVFGIRSAFMFVRSAINTITQDDQQLAADIDFMKRALAYTIEPIVRTIVNLAKTLMQYLAYIVKAWTGRDIFASANKSLKNANKSAKQLQKTSASFDKFNKLNANGSTSGGGSTPDIKSLQGNIPAWLQWIADNKDIVLSALGGIAAGLLAVKLGLTGIQGLGIGIALYGIVQTILSIIRFLNDPSFENFIDILGNIAIAVGGVAIALGAWPVALGAAIAFVVTQLLKHYDFIVGLFDNILNWFETDFLNTLHYLLGPIGDIIAQPFIIAVTMIKTAFEGLFGGLKKIINGILKIFRGDFKGGISDIFGGLKSILLSPINMFIAGFNVLIKALNKVKIPDWIPGLGGKGINIPLIPQLARGGIVNQPGRGVMMGNYIAGERGPEAVIPLNDETMNRLGDAIAKKVTVNADITLELESRVLARVMQEINNDYKFARNGG